MGKEANEAMARDSFKQQQGSLFTKTQKELFDSRINGNEEYNDRKGVPD